MKIQEVVPERPSSEQQVISEIREIGDSHLVCIIYPVEQL